MKPHCIKHIGFVTKKPTMSREAFFDYWMNRHAGLVRALPHLLRYSANVVDRARYPGFDHDGFSELWYDSEEALEASLASPQGAAVLADVGNFVERRFAIRVQEYRHLWSGG